MIKTIATFLRAGASVAVLKDALNQFQADKWSADRDKLENGDEILRYVAISGGKVVYARGQNTIFDLTCDGQMVFNFVIDLDALHSQLRRDLDEPTLFKFAG